MDDRAQDHGVQGSPRERDGHTGGSQPATPQLLFSYLRDVIYEPQNARLDIEALDAAYQDLGRGLVYFVGMVDGMRDFAAALARGDLKAPIPDRDNELASSLKALHASLRHMTWQTQQVAKGDYKQRVDFMGEYSEAFNTMIQQLDARQKALEKEIEASQKKTRALQAAGSLVADLTENISQVVVVLSEDTEKLLYSNRAAHAAFARDPDLLLQLQALPHLGAEGSPPPCLLVTQVEGEVRHYQVQPYSLQWEEQNARAYMLEDVSDRQAQVERLERLANWDELTRLNNRHFGMQTLQDWLEEGRHFTLCFLDLDNLKYVNDTFGHIEGDHYIRRAADLLRSFRAGTVTCRLGGDEFMLLVPDMASHEVVPHLEVMCDNFRRYADVPYDSSISYGVVEVEPGCNLPASTILSLADERMYNHKRQNRRQRSVFPPGSEP